MRERLIELIESRTCWNNFCQPSCMNCENVPLQDEEVERLVDYLLANGIIVPPCKVGDTLYYIPFGSTVTKWEIRSIEIMQDDIVFHCGRTFFLKYDIGKTVFLTKEEAEAALKGGAE